MTTSTQDDAPRLDCTQLLIAQGLAGLPKPTDPPSPQRPWISLGLSAALHAAILALAVHLTREPAQPPAADHSPQAAEAAREVQMVYLPPPPAVKPPPPAPPPPPPPPPPPTPPPRQQPPPAAIGPAAGERAAHTRARRQRAAGGHPRGGTGAGQRRPGRRRAHRRERSQGGLTRAGHRRRRHDGVRGAPHLRPPAARHAAGRGPASVATDGSVPARSARSDAFRSRPRRATRPPRRSTAW